MRISSTLLLLFIAISSFGQSTVTLDVEQDAMIRRFDGSGDPTNYGIYPYVIMHAWTNTLEDVELRSLIEFDLSSLENATIISATLKLYHYDGSPGTYADGHQPVSGSNSCYVRRIIEPWDETGVTWDNAPGVSSSNEGFIPQSTAFNQDYNVDVTDLVQDMVNDLSTGHGFYIGLINESFYRRMVFGSSESDDVATHPQLEIEYVASTAIDSPEEIAINLFPNPVNAGEEIQINGLAANQQNSIIELFNIQGQLIFSGYLANGKIQIPENLSSGSYLIKLENIGQRIVQIH